jgi:hypothetical protein
MRAALRDYHHGIGGDHVRPTGRQADQIPALALTVDAVFPPLVLVDKQLEFVTTPGMMGMGDAKTSCRYVWLGCS